MFKKMRNILNMVYPARHLTFYFQRLFLQVTIRNTVANYLTRQLPKSKNFITTPNIKQCVDELTRDGISFLKEFIETKEINDIHSYCQPKLCFDRTRPENGFFNLSDAPSNCHIAAYSDIDVINCPHILALANDPHILASIESLFGCKPTISNLSLWWSLPGHKDPEHAELFHRDVDDWKFIKLFIYLTDVDENAGPHVFVKGSQAENRLMPIRRYDDKEVIDNFGKENVMYLEGVSGTAFLENTFGLHKGQLPKEKKRLLLQFQYSMFPIGISEYPKIKVACPDGLNLDQYVNRLYILTT